VRRPKAKHLALDELKHYQSHVMSSQSKYSKVEISRSYHVTTRITVRPRFEVCLQFTIQWLLVVSQSHSTNKLLNLLHLSASPFILLFNHALTLVMAPVKVKRLTSSRNAPVRAAPALIPTKAGTPKRSPIRSPKKRQGVITQAQKQALIDNLQLEGQTKSIKIPNTRRSAI